MAVAVVDREDEAMSNPPTCRRACGCYSVGVSGDGKKPSPERARTDESLRTERENTDRVLLERQALVEDDADQVLESARKNADAVLVVARDKADQRLDESAPPAAMRAGIVEERASEDKALGDERALADEVLRRERAENARTLAGLLPLERDKTDRYLLTERARSDDALLQRDDFLGIVSHDLRNLLGGIVMSASILSQRAVDVDGGEHILTEAMRIKRYAARMNRLVGDLVDVASLDRGNLAITRTRGDARALIAEAVELFRPAASAKGVVLETDADAGELASDFDHGRMLQVLANLITNSIKFTSQGGRIYVRVARGEDELRFSVSDTGSGIPEGMLEAVFERFWQVGMNDRRGVGLGLYISRCIVEAHGGKIRAESTLGEGSTFVFTLPDPTTPEDERPARQS
jgi:signal transduction histidine kinase